MLRNLKLECDTVNATTQSTELPGCGGVWWLMPLMLMPRKQRKVGLYEFRVSLVYKSEV